MKCFAPALLALAALVAPIAAFAGTAEVIDPETLELAGERYRLAGIDGPEPGQACWLKSHLYDCHTIAASALIDLTMGAQVVCVPLTGPDVPAGIARCFADGYDLSEGMTYTGWALADPASGARYLKFQQGAAKAKRGLWRGRFVDPWDWRDGVRLPEETQSRE